VRLGQVDDVVSRGLLRARVAEDPGPALLGVGEPLGGTAFATGKPYAGGDRDDIDHISRIDRSPEWVDRRAPQLWFPRMG
jgi:hypothetical protein